MTVAVSHLFEFGTLRRQRDVSSRVTRQYRLTPRQSRDAPYKDEGKLSGEPFVPFRVTSRQGDGMRRVKYKEEI